MSLPGATQTVRVGPLEAALVLDGALAALVPAGWRSAPLERERVRLDLSAVVGPLEAGPGAFDVAGGLRTSSGTLTAVDGGFSGTCLADPSSLGRMLRFATAPLLLARGWLLLHAASVRLADGVHLFVAASGVGKTTLALRLEAAGAELFGDEVALVGHGRAGVHPGQPRYGVPGTEGPLAAIHLLGRGAPSMTLVRPAVAAGELLGAAMVFEDGPVAVARALEVVTGLLRDAPVYRTLVPDDVTALAPFAARLAAGAR